MKCHIKQAQKQGRRLPTDQNTHVQLVEGEDTLRFGKVVYRHTLTKANRRYYGTPDRLLHACVIDEGDGQRKVILRISGTATTMVLGCQTPHITASNP